VPRRARWEPLSARWETLRARWETLRARWVTLRGAKRRRARDAQTPRTFCRSVAGRHVGDVITPFTSALSEGGERRQSKRGSGLGQLSGPLWSERETVVGRPWLQADCCPCVVGGVNRVTSNLWYQR
jgi:ribosomal protein L44E